MSKEDEIKKLKEELAREKQERKLRDLVQDLRLDVVEKNQTGIDERFKSWEDGYDELHAAFKTAHERFNASLAAYRKALEADRQFQYQVLGFIVGAGIGWIGFLAKNQALSGSAMVVKVKEQFLGDLEGATKSLVDAKLKSVFDASESKGAIDARDAITLLRDIAKHVRHIKAGLRASIADIAKDPAKHLPHPVGPGPKNGSPEEWMRLWLADNEDDYDKTKAQIAALVAKKTTELMDAKLKQKAKPPTQAEMIERIRKTMWATWIGSRYEQEQKEGYWIPTFQRLDEMFVAAGILQSDKPPRIYRGEKLDSPYSPYNKWHRRRKSAVYDWASNWLASPHSKIEFIHEGKETAQNLKLIQQNTAHARLQSAQLRAHAIRARTATGPEIA